MYLVYTRAMPNPYATPRTTITWKVPQDLLEQIDRVAPAGTRSAWLEDAVRLRLAGDVERRGPLRQLEAKVERERAKDVRENGPGVALPCAHTYEMKSSMGRMACTNCGALKP
jgi:hypothetical protein